MAGKGDMKIEYEVEMTMAEVVEALVSVWGEDGLKAEEAVREWTPGSDEDETDYPDKDYSCGAAFCDDPACNTHGPRNPDGQLLFWENKWEEEWK